VPSSGFSIGIKINSVEFQSGGFQPSECMEVCANLEKLGLDYVELSGGTYEALALTHKQESTKTREGQISHPAHHFLATEAALCLLSAAFFLTFADMIRPALKRTKVFVTGGFRTAPAMVAAIKSGSTDGIGFGRPVCEEPYLPRMILSGEILSARRTLIDEASEFAVTLVAAGAQIKQIGYGERPLNTANPAELQSFRRELAAFMQKRMEEAKQGVIGAGHLRLTPVSRDGSML
jgi:2,4-dienoyl-CoA reductase-like NADH-dependent reductase (Old Yellow Enzyme family)